jgi:pimeloyl-ACP methyl ester carboxylesterase
MGPYAGAFGPHAPEATYVDHGQKEMLFDTGEIELNHVVAGDPASTPLLLIPGQTESWWGYAKALPMLAEHFRVYAVDLRGQGRSTRTPGRYTLDLMGNDPVRFIDGVIGRPTVVSGLSSGGVLAAWLSAYAKPGQLLAAHYEDPPLFSSELAPSVGPGIRQTIGPFFGLLSRHLGDQWKVGDWEGLGRAVQTELPPPIRFLGAGFAGGGEPPQNLKEYDPEWARAFWTGTVGQSCPHDRMLADVRVPVLFTHHFRAVDETSGVLLGAISDQQAARVRELVTGAGNALEYLSLTEMGHRLHDQDPALFTETLVSWVEGAVSVTRRPEGAFGHSTRRSSPT